MTNQEKGVAPEIVAAKELLLKQLILLCREWSRESVWEAWNVLATDQMSQFRKLFRPSQFIEDGA
jgi:hypothetical protein